MRVKLQGGREVHGVLKGFDPLVNVVLDECIEFIRGERERESRVFLFGRGFGSGLVLVFGFVWFGVQFGLICYGLALVWLGSVGDLLFFFCGVWCGFGLILAWFGLV